MKTRAEYVSKLKNELDRWNVEAAKWEAQAHFEKKPDRK